MAAEGDRLRADVFNAEQRAHGKILYFEIFKLIHFQVFLCFLALIMLSLCAAPSNPYAGPYGHPNALYPPCVYGGSVYVDNCGRSLQMGAGAIQQGAIPYGGSVPATGPVGAVTGAVTSAAGITSWSGTYNASHGPS